MHQNNDVPRFEGDKFALPEVNQDAHLDFVVALRRRVFYTQGEAADYFGLNRSTIQRYETGQIRRVPPGYMAELAILFSQNERIGADALVEVQAQLLQELNNFLKWSPHYRGEQLFFEWADLEACATRYLPPAKVEQAAQPESVVEEVALTTTEPIFSTEAVLPGSFYETASAMSAPKPGAAPTTKPDIPPASQPLPFKKYLDKLRVAGIAYMVFRIIRSLGGKQN